MYGPGSQSSLDTLLAKYHSSIYGGGIYDYGEDHADITRTVRKRVGREDADVMQKYVESHSGDIPDRELEAYILYFVNEMSLTQCSKQMEVARETVYATIKNLRKRLADTMVKESLVGPRIRKHGQT